MGGWVGGWVPQSSAFGYGRAVSPELRSEHPVARTTICCTAPLELGVSKVVHGPHKLWRCMEHRGCFVVCPDQSTAAVREPHMSNRNTLWRYAAAVIRLGMLIGAYHRRCSSWRSRRRVDAVVPLSRTTSRACTKMEMSPCLPVLVRPGQPRHNSTSPSPTSSTISTARSHFASSPTLPWLRTSCNSGPVPSSHWSSLWACTTTNASFRENLLVCT